MEQAWAGVDVGKEHHHCVVIDAEGRRLLSRRVANDEAVLPCVPRNSGGLEAMILGLTCGNASRHASGACL